jgi:hypothetical protein
MRADEVDAMNGNGKEEHSVRACDDLVIIQKPNGSSHSEEAFMSGYMYMNDKA